MSQRRCWSAYAALLFVVLSGAPAFGAYSLRRTYPSPSLAGGDQFGATIASLDGWRFIVGARGDPTTAPNAGAVYLFDPETTDLQQSFFDGDGASGDRLGSSAAVLWPDEIGLGAPGVDVGATDGGAIQFFDVNSGNRLRTFGRPTAIVDERFGTGIGGRFTWAEFPGQIAVGGAGGGTVYLLDPVTGDTLASFTNPTGSPGFGSTVVTNGGYGGSVFVGSPNDGTGKVYEFDIADGMLTRTYVNPDAEAGVEFGASIWMAWIPPYGGVFIGAPGANGGGAVYGFSAVDAQHLVTWSNPAPVLASEFGRMQTGVDQSNAMQILVGSPGGAGGGRAYLIDSATGTVEAAIDNPDPDIQRFGAAGALFWSWFVVGAPGNASHPGVAYLFTNCGDEYEQPGEMCDDGNQVDDDCCSNDCQMSLDVCTAPAPCVGPFTLRRTLESPAPDFDAFGYSVTAVESDHMLVGAPADSQAAPMSGLAYIVDLTTGEVVQALPNPIPGEQALFGLTVATGSGWFAVGAPMADFETNEGAGVVYTFDASGAALPALARPPIELGALGWSMVSDGMHLAVVGPYEGVVRLYDVATGAVIAKYESPDTLEEFGMAVALTPDRVIVGSPELFAGTGAGKVYVYDRSTTALLYTFFPQEPTTWGFGSAVAVRGDRLVVGAPSGEVRAVYEYNLADFSIVRILTAPHPCQELAFGKSLTFVEDNLIVGAPWDDGDGVRGAVYVYDATGLPVQTIENPRQDISFGRNVATVERSVVVGASNEDAAHVFSICGNGGSDGGEACDDGNDVDDDCCTNSCEINSPACGAPAPCDGPFTLRRVLENPQPLTDGSATRVTAIGNDRILVGVPADSQVEPYSGVAYVVDVATGQVEQTLANPVPSEFAMFGETVAAGSGWVAVGAPYAEFEANQDAGIVHTFDATGVALPPLARPPIELGNVGSYVATDGTILAVAGPNEGIVRLHNVTTGAVMATYESPDSVDEFGRGIALTNERVIVGSPDFQIEGRGRVFVYDRTTAAILETLEPAEETTRGFGVELAVRGNRLIVGAPFGDVRAVYEYDLTTFDLVRILTNPHPCEELLFGYSLAFVGDDLLVGAPLDGSGVIRGAIYVYDGSGTHIQTIASPPPGHHEFGGSLAVVGNSIVVASKDERLAYVYTVCGNGTVDPGEECDDDNTESGDGCSATCESEGGGGSTTSTSTTSTPDTTTTTTTLYPPDPSTIAPPVNPSVPTTVGESTEFLYTGPDPLQKDVTATIEVRRAAVIKGRVLAAANVPLTAVTVSIAGHPEYGWTLSRADGEFDLAVNGGGPLTVEYRKTGYFTAQRQVHVHWNGFARADDVILIAPDSAVTTIGFESPIAMQVHVASEVEDDDGARQAVIMVPAGTEATMRLPNGTISELSSMDVRLTEYTVGADGPDRMPAPLPPASAYTYAIEMSADEAIAANADEVTFSTPLPFYVDNFLGMPVGVSVPLGWYDRRRNVWVPANDGRVIEIVEITGGLASVDIDGDTIADDPELLSITEPERQRLAELYTVGKTLWRVRIPHFTPWDCNWPYGPPDDAEDPDSDAEEDEEDDDDCEDEGCIIEVQSQGMRETIPVIGTPFTLNYSSKRVPGRQAARTVQIKASGASVPTSLQRIEVTVHVAGRTFTEELPPEPNQRHTFVWDGLDGYGRFVTGGQAIEVVVGYVYQAEYKSPEVFASSFALFGGSALSGNQARFEVTLSRYHRLEAGVSRWDPRTDFGGWSLNPHHVYDPTDGTLYLGDGRIRHLRDPAGGRGQAVATVGGDGIRGSGGDGGPANEARVAGGSGIAVGPDGSVYFADEGEFTETEVVSWPGIRRIRPDGVIERYAGVTTAPGEDEPNCTGDGGPALAARLANPTELVTGLDGSLIFGDAGCGRLRRIAPDGIISTLATDHSFKYLAQMPDGAIIFSDKELGESNSGEDVVYRLGTDGIITVFAGQLGVDGFAGDGGPATQALLDGPSGLSVARDGTVYVADARNGRIRQILPDGTIHTYAGIGDGNLADDNGDGGPALQAVSAADRVVLGVDGSLYEVGSSHVRRISPDRMMSFFMGFRAFRIGWFGYTVDGFNGDNRVPADTMLDFLGQVAEGPDGDLYFTERGRIRRVRPILPARPLEGNILIASEDGSEIYKFTGSGRHRATYDGLTQRIKYEFEHDEDGRLTAIYGPDLVLATIDPGSQQSVITAGGGQETTVFYNEDGWARRIENPAGAADRFEYTPDGLLEKRTTPRGKVYEYDYDDDGRFSTETDPAGGTKTLERETVAGGFRVVETSGGGVVEVFGRTHVAGGQRQESYLSPGGLSTTVDTADHGAQIITSATGEATTVSLTPDPVFGMQAPNEGSFLFSTPGGVLLSRTTEREVILADAADPMSAISETTTITENGATAVVSYDADTRTRTAISPEGRLGSMTFDESGRVVHARYGGLAASEFSYDDGLLSTITRTDGQDSRETTFGYDELQRLTSLTDARGDTTTFAYDDSDRLTSQTYPDGRVASFDYDLDGNLTHVTPPGKPEHILGYTPVDLGETYAAPDVGLQAPPVSYQYNSARQVTAVEFPSGDQMTFTYDPTTGVLSEYETPTESVAFGYNQSTGVLESITSTTGEDLAFSFDGPLLTSVTWDGTLSASVGYQYNSSLQVSRIQVNSSHAVTFDYDDDGLLTDAGAMDLHRDSSHGRVDATVLGGVSDGRTFNGFGESVTYSASHSSAGPYLTINYPDRDGLGRLLERRESVLGGLEHTTFYEYDERGRLSTVSTSASNVEYSYDENGNRLSRKINGVVVESGSYDAQDRLVSYGDATYSYTASGDLSAKTTPTQQWLYDFDVTGRLKSVTLPSGSVVEYVLDPSGRRVGKRVNGVLVQRFVYESALRIAAELDASGAVLSRFVHAGSNTPLYMAKGGSTYRILTDDLGSPRLVVNVSTGAVVQRIDYDEFGRVVADTNPGFQPFGFAGGLYDRDTGLVQFGAREYDPTVGRFTQKDPIGFQGGDSNLYSYALADPVNLRDPNGKCVSLGLAVTLALLYSAWPANAPGPGDALESRPDPLTDLQSLLDGADLGLKGSVRKALKCAAKEKKDRKDPEREKKQDLVNRIARELGMTRGQREIFHRKGLDHCDIEDPDDLRERMESVVKGYPNK